MTTSHTDAHGATLAVALAAIEQATRLSAQAVAGAGTAQEAYDVATELRERLRNASDGLAAARARAAARIRDEESLTLAPLAQRLGLSTTRAHQLMQLARKEEGEPTDG